MGRTTRQRQRRRRAARGPGRSSCAASSTPRPSASQHQSRRPSQPRQQGGGCLLGSLSPTALRSGRRRRRARRTAPRRPSLRCTGGPPLVVPLVMPRLLLRGPLSCPLPKRVGDSTASSSLELRCRRTPPQSTVRRPQPVVAPLPSKFLPPPLPIVECSAGPGAPCLRPLRPPPRALARGRGLRRGGAHAPSRHCRCDSERRRRRRRDSGLPRGPQSRGRRRAGARWRRRRRGRPAPRGGRAARGGRLHAGEGREGG